MIDLTNKTVEEINGLIQKYSNVLQLFKPQEQPHFAYIINVAVNHIKENYPELPIDWKAWAVVTLKKQISKVGSESDIKKILDDFIVYYTTDYQKYIDGLGLFASEYDRDLGFVHTYLHKKNR